MKALPRRLTLLSDKAFIASSCETLWVRISILVMCSIVLAVAAVPSPALADFAPTARQESAPTPIDLAEFDGPLGGIIPEPNSGRAPTNPGDLGGSLQLTLLGLIVAFGALAVFSVRRASKKALGARTSTEIANPDIDPPPS